MFDKDSISRIWGSCDDSDVWRKLRLKKSNDAFDFLGTIFITHQGSCDDYDGAGECVDGCLTKIATEKIEPTISIFLAVIFVTQFPPSTVLRILNSQNCLTKTQYREFVGPAIVMG